MQIFKTKANSVVEAIYINSKETPDSKCVADSSSLLTYSEFWHEICNCAKKLKQLGLQKNSRVFVEAHPLVEYLVTYFAIQLLHCTAIPYSSKLSKDTIDWYISTREYYDKAGGAVHARHAVEAFVIHNVHKIQYLS